MNPGSREPMTTVSSDNPKTWIATTDERPSALEVILLKRTYVLPWTQFLYAEGEKTKSGSPSPPRTL